MRKAKQILILCLAVLQVALVVRSAIAMPMAQGSFTSVVDPEYATSGQLLTFSLTAVNDGELAGWFRICVIKVSPSYREYFPTVTQVYAEEAVHCSVTLQLNPGETITFESMKFRMMSVPNETFWVILTVQQQAPIPTDTDASDIINLTIDQLNVVVVTNFHYP